jgi:NTE family protein
VTIHITGVFEGGGIKGIALAGAAMGAQQLGFQFDQAVGTSAGAIVSALIAAGYTGEELKEITTSISWPQMLDRDFISRIPGIGKHISMTLHKGVYLGHRLERTIETLLAARGIKTFGDLPPGSLRVVSTDLNHGRGVVLPDSLAGFGHDADSFPVARAVMMSAAVPFVFRPVPLEDRSNGEILLMADGAMTARFPVQLVPRDESVVGFRLIQTDGFHVHREINGPLSLASAVMRSGITAREDLPVLCGRLARLVSIELDRDSLDFNIDKADAGEMFEIGRLAAASTLATVTT